MRVLIADDHAMFRRGLKETIGEAFPKVTFAEAKTAQETLELVRQQDWEIVMPLLRRHGQIAAEHGLRAVYHHHTGWIAETMEQYERLLEDVDRRYVGAMLDCGHATKDFRGHSALELQN